MIGIVAGPEVGKTTLIATMYELIHRGKMASFGFAGSETLRGYEERAFFSRTASRRITPDTPRTKIQDISFTHLRLATQSGIKDVYFSDRSGEQFDDALNKSAKFVNFAELKRAEIILLMVDLKQLMTNPQPVRSSTKRLFMGMQETGILVGKVLILVGTKADLLPLDEDRYEVGSRLEKIRNDLQNFSSQGREIQSLIVSSRARKGTNIVGEGLEKLLVDILSPPPQKPFSLGEAMPTEPSRLDALMTILRRRLQ